MSLHGTEPEFVIIIGLDASSVRELSNGAMYVFWCQNSTLTFRIFY